MRSLVRGGFVNEFVETGDEGAAKARAMAALRRTFGVSRMMGSPRLMRLPIEDFYNPIDGSYNWLRDQLVAETNIMVHGDLADIEPGDLNEFMGFFTSMGEAFFGDQDKRITADEIFLKADDETQMDIASSRAARYLVFYMDKSGQLQQVPGRFVGDPAVAQATREQAHEPAFAAEKLGLIRIEDTARTF